MNEKLEPCPFCGNAAVKVWDESFCSVKCFMVHCRAMDNGCNARGPQGITPEAAAQKWNERAA